MRDGSQHPRWQPRGSSQAANHLDGVTFSSLERYAARQLQQMEALGALFAERVPAPLLIKNPLPQPASSAILLTRWVGGNVFGVLFPNPQGEPILGWISISQAMRVNPELTPSGTLSHEPWDKNIFTRRDHLLPSPKTIEDRSIKAARLAATELLKEFPSRVDLTPTIDTRDQEHQRICEICNASVQPLVKEIQKGLRVANLLKKEDAQIHKLLSDVVKSLLQKTVILHALRAFTAERMKDAREARAQGLEIGIIHELTNDSADTTAMTLYNLVTTTLRKSPLAPPPSDELARQSGVGLAISMARHRQYKELWKHLEPAERNLILTSIGRQAWVKAVQTYASRN